MTSTNRGGAPLLDNNDRIVLIFAAPFLLPIAAGAVPQWRDSAVAYLIDHGVLLPAESSRFVLPVVDAGVDMPRAVLAAAVIVAVGSAVLSAARVALRHRRHNRLHSGDRL